MELLEVGRFLECKDREDFACLWHDTLGCNGVAKVVDGSVGKECLLNVDVQVVGMDYFQDALETFNVMFKRRFGVKDNVINIKKCILKKFNFFVHVLLEKIAGDHESSG
eukprot:12176937-Ditylum_brightwellii.AAC.1